MKRKLLQIIFEIILLIAICTIVFAENIENTENTITIENIEDLQNRRDELKNQIEESNEEIEQIQLEITENLEQLNSLNSKIEAYEADIENLQNNLNILETEIQEVQERLERVEENYNLQRNALQNRIVALYENGDILYLDVLLNSSNISEFISNYFLIGEIARYDSNLLEDIENQKIQIEHIKINLEEKQTSIKNLKENKEKTATALENSRVIRNSYINKLTEQEKETQTKIDEYNEELNNLDRRILELATLNSNLDYVGGEFLWPAPGYYTITSRFGPRIHPILKIPRSHSGTDIACPTGTNILAANGGIVIASEYSTSGYGYMVMIDHGGGIVTLYGHGSELIAEVGNTVKKGDVIMKSGSTGWSTGPHLHFEIRINGVAVDSLPYITGGKTSTNTENNTTNNTISSIENSIVNNIIENT